MIPREPGDTTKEAFRLFEDGRFPESLAACNRMLEEEKDPALEVLAATNLFHAGRYEDAEVFFRDLAVRMPGSSYVHSYLGKVLEARGNDEATSEYAAAVRLDPANQDALRSYAGYLLSRNDFRGALPLLLHLTELAGTEKDTGNLVRALIGCGRGGGKLLHSSGGRGESRDFYRNMSKRSSRYRTSAVQQSSRILHGSQHTTPPCSGSLLMHLPGMTPPGRSKHMLQP